MRGVLSVRSVWVTLWMLVCVLVLAQASAQNAAINEKSTVILLGDDRAPGDLRDTYSVWIEDARSATVEEVHGHANRFQPVPRFAVLPVSGGKTLWVHLRIRQPLPSKLHWTLDVPLPFLDKASLYQLNASGAWGVQRAGSLLPKSEWTRSWLYPSFDLELPDGSERDVYLRIENVADQTIPIRLSPADHAQGMGELTLLGLVMGLLLALSVLSAYRFMEYRNPANAGAALVGVILTLTVAQINGVATLLVWPESAAWGNIAYGVLPLFALGAVLLFLRQVYGLLMYYRQFDRVFGAIGWATLFLPLVFVVLPLAKANILGGGMLALATVVAFLATVLHARQGSTIARWMLVVLTPQFLVILWLAADQFGVLPTVWQMRYVMSFLLAVTVPLLTYSLHVELRDKNEVSARANMLSVQDALTGLLTREAFISQAEKAFPRVIEDVHPYSLVVVNLVDYEHIRQTYSDRVAEQCLLRAVVKLHRVMRDIDQAGRIGTSSFAILVDGVRSREDLNRLIVGLIASGLQSSPGLEPQIALRFHAACLMLLENPMEPAIAVEELENLVVRIKPGTRRPIRYIEPESTQVEPDTTQGAPFSAKA